MDSGGQRRTAATSPAGRAENGVGGLSLISHSDRKCTFGVLPARIERGHSAPPPLACRWTAPHRAGHEGRAGGRADRPSSQVTRQRRPTPRGATLRRRAGETTPAKQRTLPGSARPHPAATISDTATSAGRHLNEGRDPLAISNGNPRTDPTARPPRRDPSAATRARTRRRALKAF